MAMAYIKVFYDWLDLTDLLSLEERGRLIDALVLYSRDGIVTELPGNERFVFPQLIRRLDGDAERYARVCARRRAGLRNKEDKGDKEDKEDEGDKGDKGDQEDNEPSVLQKINDNWRTSARARGAVAQCLVDQLVLERTACSAAGNLYDVVLKGLDAGVCPEEILRLGRSGNPASLSLHIYERGLSPA